MYGCVCVFVCTYAFVCVRACICVCAYVVSSLGAFQVSCVDFPDRLGKIRIERNVELIPLSAQLDTKLMLEIKLECTRNHTTSGQSENIFTPVDPDPHHSNPIASRHPRPSGTVQLSALPHPISTQGNQSTLNSLQISHTPHRHRATSPNSPLT